MFGGHHLTHHQPIYIVHDTDKFKGIIFRIWPVFEGRTQRAAYHQSHQQLLLSIVGSTHLTKTNGGQFDNGGLNTEAIYKLQGIILPAQSSIVRHDGLELAG